MAREQRPDQRAIVLRGAVRAAVVLFVLLVPRLLQREAPLAPRLKRKLLLGFVRQGVKKERRSPAGQATSPQALCAAERATSGVERAAAASAATVLAAATRVAAALAAAEPSQGSLRPPRPA